MEPSTQGIQAGGDAVGNGPKKNGAGAQETRRAPDPVQ